MDGFIRCQHPVLVVGGALGRCGMACRTGILHAPGFRAGTAPDSGSHQVAGLGNPCYDENLVLGGAVCPGGEVLVRFPL